MNLHIIVFDEEIFLGTHENEYFRHFLHQFLQFLENIK